MGFITERKKKNGAITYTAQIRINKGGIIHSEAKSSPDKKFLQHWLFVRERALAEHGALEALKHSGTTITAVLEWYEKDFDGMTKFGRTKLATIKQLKKSPFLAELDATKAEASDFIRYARERRASGVAGSTVNGDFIWMRSALRSARLARGVNVNLQALDDAAQLLRSERVIGPGKKRDRRPTLDELEALYRLFEKSDNGRKSKVKMRHLFLFALFSGRRQEEVCTIRWDDIDERRQGVLVRDMKHPREKIDTFCYFTDQALAVLKNVPRTDEYIFPYNSKTVSERFTKACKLLEIKDLRFHDLRHECVSWLFELGWDIPRVSNVSGHRSWSSLQRYTHLREHNPHNKYAGWWVLDELFNQ
ncbi:tyrosine-type recombinase/integrase [Marinagarivorans algicola]|uniref:tyrosine-type recombinase/integrase n=1 Tax=Marinagarivorans algicola TaxID=1513270 RepID=UPI0037352DBF